ncbi:hypothetical protein GX888_01105 [Candidatus Dojkabacteria bacterium]|uniref:Bacterial Ig-like domain-containing protein n=1 Tax=Candidatus Dojkabacteria bacterium TaxID=2099670 RepID=A0A847VD56_9BACT|nr:hypothetical protein [Candidatus Dojkabacteria bacterium]
MRFLESITEFSISVDGTALTGVNFVDGTFNYTLSLSSYSVGNHTLVVTVKDNYGKTDSKSVIFTVEPPSGE